MPVLSHRTRPFRSSERLPQTDDAPVRQVPEHAGGQLAEFIRRHPRLLILTGAG